MPGYRRLKYAECDRIYHRELIWRNAYELYKRRGSLTPKTIIKLQTYYINSLNIQGKNKLKSVDCLRQYLHTDERVKGVAEQAFLNTLSRMIPNFREN